MTVKPLDDHVQNNQCTALTRETELNNKDHQANISDIQRLFILQEQNSKRLSLQL